jgi:prevent-host-death family protein
MPAGRTELMTRLNVVELKNSLGNVLNRAEFKGETFVVQRRGKDSAAIISIEDLRLLERLRQEAEDRADVETARAALAESDERISYAEFRRRPGLSDEPKPKKRRTSPKAGAPGL